MLQVLTEHGFVPDRIYGSSVGAVNGVAFAGDPTRKGVERMTEIWRGLTRDDVYPQGRLHGPWLYVQQRDSVYPNTGLRKVIENGIDFERLEDALVPVEVVATSLDRRPGAVVHLRIGHGRGTGVDRGPGHLPPRGDRRASGSSTEESSTTFPSPEPSSRGPPGSWSSCAAHPPIRRPPRGDPSRPCSTPC